MATILIVEDDPIMAQDLQGQLLSLGHIVLACASSGQEALARIRAQRPDVVLMGIRLARGMDAWAAGPVIELSDAARRRPPEADQQTSWIAIHGSAEDARPAARSEPVDGCEDIVPRGGGGELGTLMRALDWAQTPVGPISQWPQALRTVVSICSTRASPWCCGGADLPIPCSTTTPTAPSWVGPSTRAGWVAPGVSAGMMSGTLWDR